MKRQTKTSTPAEYIARLDEPRRADIAALDTMIRKIAPELEPFVHGNVLAYGHWHYKYATGREGDWFRIGVASNKSSISLHICAGDKNGYIAEQYKDLFPTADIGKACVRFKRLSDLDQPALMKMIRHGVRAAQKW